MSDKILESMSSSPYVICDNEWREEHDFFFTYNGQNMRTRVEFDANEMTMPTTTIIKTCIKNIDLKRTCKYQCEHAMDMRISLKKEQVVENYPLSTSTDYVRIKQKKRILLKNSPWAFDFSITWSGKTKHEADIK
jgi:hypothetical protein